MAKIRGKYNLTKIPIDVEELAELNLGIDIIPGEEIEEISDSGGWLSVHSDPITIYIDTRVYWQDKHEFFRRFSVSHELGHFFLHLEELQKITFSSTDEWKKIVSDIDERDLVWMEQQSNIFAAVLMAPNPEFDVAVRKCINEQISQLVLSAKKEGLSREQYLDYSINTIARSLSPTFKMSCQALEYHIKNSGLEKYIP